MLSESYIVEISVNDAADHADDQKPLEVPAMVETRNLLHLLHNKAELSGADQKLMRCIEQLENASLETQCGRKIEK